MKHLEEFIALLSKVVKDKEIKEDTELKGLGIDSLDLVEILMDAEDKYGIEFDNDELASFVTVGDVVKAIDAKIK